MWRKSEFESNLFLLKDDYVTYFIFLKKPNQGMTSLNQSFIDL